MEQALKLIIQKSPNAAPQAITCLRALSLNSPVVNKRFSHCVEIALNDPQADFTPEERSILVDAMSIGEPSGRPPLYGESMRQTAVWLPDEMITWLKSQGNMSETIRELIEQAMKE
jgi:hypothetical protein